MDPENNNLDWFGNLRLQINDFLAEASAVIPQDPIQQARHQFTAVKDRFKRIYAEVLEDLPMFLSYGPEEDVSSYLEEEQEENGLPPLTNSNISFSHNFQEGGIEGVDSSIPSLPVETEDKTNGVLSSMEGATGTTTYIAVNRVEGDVQNTHSSIYSEEEEEDENGLPTNANSHISSDNFLKSSLNSLHSSSPLPIEVTPKNIESELEFHESCADPYMQVIIALIIGTWLESDLKLLDPSTPLPNLAEDDTNRVLFGENGPVGTELDNSTTISVESHEHCADSNVQEKNIEDHEDSCDSDIDSYLRDVDSYDSHSDWSGDSSDSDSDSDSLGFSYDSDSDSDSDSLGFSYDSDSDSPSDWSILDDDNRVIGADWNMVE